MDFTLTLLILIFGLILIGFIYFAAVRAQVSRREKKDMRKFEKMLEQSQGKDREGFDINGVSEVRLVESSQEKAAHEKENQETIRQEPANEETRTDKILQNELVEKASVETENFEHEKSLVEEVNEQNIAKKAEVKKQLAENPLADDAGDDVPVLSEYLFGSKKEPTLDEESREQKSPRSADSEPAQASLFSEDKSEPEISEPVVEPELIFSLYIVANPEQPYVGEALVEKLLELGMRHGDMDIFHRHSQSTGRGPVQFSLANAYDPGTFDLDNLKNLETKGLAVFMALPGPKTPMKAYEMMASTCRSIVEDLGGHIIDSSKAHYSKQIEAHHKEQIQEFERKLLLKK